MNDSEDDIFSASTVPYDNSDSSIYEDETQAIEVSNCEYVLNDDPTQPLIIASRRNLSTSSAEINQGTTNYADSDCDTIPADSPTLGQDRNDEVDFQKKCKTNNLIEGDQTQLLVPKEICKSQSPHSSSALSASDFDNSKKTYVVDSSVSRKPRKASSPQTAFYDGPTQPLLIESCKSNISEHEDISEMNTMPIHLYDGPTQPLVMNSQNKSNAGEHSGEQGSNSFEKMSLYEGPTQPLFTASRVELNTYQQESSSARSGKDTSNSGSLRMSPLQYPESFPTRRNSTQTSDMDIEDEDDETQVIDQKFPERGSVCTTVVGPENNDVSDSETIPSSPVLHLESPVAHPSTQVS